MKTIDELVRLGTQIEKDWAESKKDGVKRKVRNGRIILLGEKINLIA